MNGGHGGLRGFNHPASWVEAFPSLDQQLVRLPVATGRNFNGLNIWHWDWGPIDVTDNETEDGQAVTWAESVLAREHEQPFFLAVGIYKPHGPWYCPPAYFEQHQHETIALPNVPDDDLDDVPMIAHRGNMHRTIVEAVLYEEAVQAYLANVSFADAMVGRLLNALDSSPARENTIVVLWSDHGWHLGEKQHWHKGTNWEEGTRVPLIVAVPDMPHAGAECAEPVSLVDIYPTLLELCDLPTYEQLDGLSLVPQLNDPTTPRNRPAYTINNGRHQSVRTRQWRYIRYSDGSEELYDHAADPDEFHNLASQPEYDALKSELAAWFPEVIQRFDFENPSPYEDGFRLVFNGYDLNTWEGEENVWRVEDGMIVGDASRASLDNQLIWRGGTLNDFELRLRYRIAGEGVPRILTRASMEAIELRSGHAADENDWHDLTIICAAHAVNTSLMANWSPM